MAANYPSIRTALEYAGILALIYLYFGAPKSETPLRTSRDDSDFPVSQDKIETLVYPNTNLQCPEHNYDVHIFSRSPLIIYIPNFVSKEESEHLISLSAPNWTPSTIFTGTHETNNTSIRKSEKALLPRDTTVQCLEARALDFQGWPRHTYIERLWTQRYTRSGHYSHHYDWASESSVARRVSTFMVYLAANCSGGGTNFPYLERPADPKWCEFVDCGTGVESTTGSGSGGEKGGGVTGESDDDDGIQGVTFLPRAGAAVYWENFDQDGRGYKEGLHAGLPVTEGVKIGLNVWSWYQRGHEPDLSPSAATEDGKTEL